MFGNETAGLANDEVMQCNRLACIPSHADYRSLNLAAAVQVIAYECRVAALAVTAPAGPAAQLASHEEAENFFAHLQRSLHASGFLDPENPRRLMQRLRRLFLRSNLEKEEIHILRGILSAWENPRPPKRK